MVRAIVEPATLRDASYVMANLRPADAEEVACQVPPGLKTYEAAYNLLMGCDAYIARIGRDPVAFFGVGPINVACLSVWALGTTEIWRAVPAINRFLVDDLLPAKMAEGYRTLEARSLASHEQAHRWLVAMGGQQHGPPFEFGSDRQQFLLFRFTMDAFESIKAKRGTPRPGRE